MDAEPCQPDPSGPGQANNAMEPLACVMCRSRKLKCDRTKPACARCRKVGGECVYPESRRKPTFKRRNVKEIEARLAQVESYLKEVNRSVDERNEDAAQPSDAGPPQADFGFKSHGPGLQDSFQGQTGSVFGLSDFRHLPEDAFSNDEEGALMGLGYSEPLPPFQVQEELNSVFFAIPYHFIPIIHSGRYYSSFYSGPLRKPPMSLQYAVWAMAANGHAKYDQYCQVFYKRARQYMEADEMKDHGQHFITVAHAQALCLIATFEAKCLLFTRAATSCAKAVRLCQMLGLDRLDDSRDDLPPSLGPHTTWEELEERRRVFWGAFAIDSHASISTGWPALINPDDITTRLPASEEAFVSGREEIAPFLDEVFSGSSYSSFAGTLVNCLIFRAILKHVHRCKPSDNAQDMMDGPFWKRHRDLDNQLSSIFMFLPPRFRLPASIRDPGAIHANLNLHAAVILLHHAALEKAELHDLGDNVMETNLCRLRNAAEEIVNIVKMSSHSANIFKSPLCALSFYCCTTVYVYMAKKNPTSGITPLDKSNLELIFQAMEAIGRNHEVTCAFLQQACLDIERNNLKTVLKIPNLDKYRNLYGGSLNSNIPLITRSSVSNHSKRSPVLPGRLPLDQPQGSILPERLKMHVVREMAASGSSASVADCFSAVLGAATRNVAADPSVGLDNKRGRMSTSSGQMNATVESIADDEPTINLAGQASMLGNDSGFGLQNPLGDAAFILPDRTNSSTSSPAYRPGMSGSSDPLSGSSHTTPPGLGNTPEENRIDLRAFQDRVPQMWQSTQIQSMQDSLFTANMAEALFSRAGLDDNTVANWEAWTGESMAWRPDMPFSGL